MSKDRKRAILLGWLSWALGNNIERDYPAAVRLVVAKLVILK